MKDKAVGKQIINFMLVILAGVVCAILVSVLAIYYLSPSREQYTLDKILLSPKIAQKITFPEVNPRTGKTTTYSFDHIELLYYDERSRAWNHKEIPLERYEKFYRMISTDKSLPAVPSDLKGLYLHANPAILTLVIREIGDATKEPERAFQEVQFVPEGSYYRVQLREQTAGEPWAYFLHENIYNKMLNTLLDSPNEQ